MIDFINMIETTRKTKEQQTAFIEQYIVANLPKDGINRSYDDYGNLYVSVGNNNQDVTFMSHVDTVNRETVCNIKTVVDGDFLELAEDTDANCLGADCTTGIYIMLKMIEAGVNGLYCFFLDEEIGCKGSRYAAVELHWENINHAISFDRMGYDSIITHQCGYQTASYEFTDELITRFKEVGLDYKRDSGGVFTDSNEFTGIIANCTNISVGYFNQHTKRESQDLVFLDILVEACIRMDFSGLPIGEITDTVLWDDSIQTDDDVLVEVENILNYDPSFEDKLWKLINDYHYNTADGLIDDERDPFYFNEGYRV